MYYEYMCCVYICCDLYEMVYHRIRMCYIHSWMGNVNAICDCVIIFIGGGNVNDSIHKRGRAWIMIFVGGENVNNYIHWRGRTWMLLVIVCWKWISDLCIIIYVSSAYSSLTRVLLNIRINNYFRIHAINWLILKVVLKSKVSGHNYPVWRRVMSLAWKIAYIGQ